MTIQECAKYMSANGYLAQLNGTPYLTSKFYKDVVALDIGLVIVGRNDITVKEPGVKMKKPVTIRGGVITEDKDVPWTTLYTQFIMEAEIPRVAYTGRGGSYQVNLSTKPGREAFRRAMLEGESYDSLLEKAKRYYSSTQMPVKVENFFEKELWRNDIDNGDDFYVAGSLG